MVERQQRAVRAHAERAVRGVHQGVAVDRRASLVTGPLSAGSFSCPSGQTLVLASVSYTNCVLTDTTNNVSATLADVSRTFVDLR